MSDPAVPPPQVEVRLPDGRTTSGRLLSWRQGPDGNWRALVSLQVPASAISKMPGEDYTSVPRKAAAPGYVLATDTRIQPGSRPTQTLHKADCLIIGKRAGWTRVTPVDGADQARDALRFDDTTACEMCSPEP